MIAKSTKSKNVILAELKRSRDFGLKLLSEFHKHNQKFSGYKISFEQLVSTLEKRPGQKHFVEILGSVIDSGVSHSQAMIAMQSLAMLSQGKIPSQNVNFRQAIIDHATQFNFVDAVVFTATESAKDIVNASASIGNTLVGTGKLLNLLLPIAVVYFGYKFLSKKIE